MKQVPYKCKFDHITIREFYSNQSTTGTIICEKCLEMGGEQILKLFKDGVSD